MIPQQLVQSIYKFFRTNKNIAPRQSVFFEPGEDCSYCCGLTAVYLQTVGIEEGRKELSKCSPFGVYSKLLRGWLKENSIDPDWSLGFMEGFDSQPDDPIPIFIIERELVGYKYGKSIANKLFFRKEVKS